MTALVLMYHRIAAVEDDTYGLAVRPDRFAGHVEELRARGGVVPLQEVLTTGRAPAIAVTFDDGYADNAALAAPALAAAGLPVTYFVTTGTLGGQRFWWDRLAHGLLGPHPVPAGLDVAVGDRAVWADLSSAPARLTALRFLHRRLRYLPPDELAAAVDALLAQLGAPEPPADDRTMTVAQLRETAALPGVEIGAHTRTHLELAGKRPDLQEQEIAGSMADLAALLGRPVTSFAYPFGSRGAVGGLAPRLAREAGCTVACSTEPGPVGRRADRWMLPRLNVRDWDRDEFAARIDRLLEGN